MKIEAQHPASVRLVTYSPAILYGLHMVLSSARFTKQSKEDFLPAAATRTDTTKTAFKSEAILYVLVLVNLQQEFANRLTVLSADHLQQLVALLHTHSFATNSALQVLGHPVSLSKPCC